jgi:DHA1 family bicyclomycin/chloramphenicol resistance-like MFS transporter
MSIQMRPARLHYLFFLGALAALPPISIDMALPALTRIGHDLNAGAGLVGLTLSLFMLGFSISPVVLGPFSDRLGRRPCLIGGMVLFAAGGIMAASAQSIGVLLCARLVQGAGAGAGMTLAFAVVRDRFEGADAQFRLAVITIISNIAPIVAPAIGAALLVPFGWRGIYAITAIGGVLLTLVVWLSFGETAALEARRAAARVGFGDAYRRLFREPSAVAHILVNGLGFAWMFGYVTGSPLILIGQFHVSAAFYAGMFALTGIGIAIGAMLNGKLAQRGVASARLLLGAILLALAATVVLTVMAWLDLLSIGSMMPLLILTTFSFGLAAPSAAHGALEPLPELAGVAGGVLTSVQMLMGAICSSVVASLVQRYGAAGMSATMAVAALLALGVYVRGIRGIATPRVA